MKSNNRVKGDEARSIYQSFKEYSLKSKGGKVDLNQLYVVPWALMNEDSKRWALKH